MGSEDLRRPLLLVALGLSVMIVLFETGLSARLLFLSDRLASSVASSARPGYGIAYLVCIDALLLYGTCLMTLSLVLSKELVGRLQGAVGVAGGVIALLAFGAMLFVALQMLILMVSLLLAPPFGMAVYAPLFAHFERARAAATLGVLTLLKLLTAGALVLAHPRFIENKSLVVLLALSLGCTLLVGFLQALPPGFLVSVTDAAGAVCVAAIGCAWAVVLLVGSCIATVKAVV
ncbi:hypothetical protein [Caballeronia sp. ATUFL_M2_KS44]|uniref:hypothetical protein n=1 Tax=Caballeronia sp. ATUFL_M2_KS44 TaxID=2921767 RepID=UPI00202987E7|nr:hypothetical protein [Caballeronia sp. ATUFL_M2_KS44]